VTRGLLRDAWMANLLPSVRRRRPRVNPVATPKFDQVRFPKAPEKIKMRGAPVRDTAHLSYGCPQGFLNKENKWDMVQKLFLYPIHTPQEISIHMSPNKDVDGLRCRDVARLAFREEGMRSFNTCRSRTHNATARGFKKDKFGSEYYWADTTLMKGSYATRALGQLWGVLR
jgi:hypothetical protein